MQEFKYSRNLNEANEDLLQAREYLQKPSQIFFEMKLMPSIPTCKHYKVFVNYLTVADEWEEAIVGNLRLCDQQKGTLLTFESISVTIGPHFWSALSSKLAEMEALSLSSDDRPSKLATHIHKEYGLPLRYKESFEENDKASSTQQIIVLHQVIHVHYHAAPHTSTEQPRTRPEPPPEDANDEYWFDWFYRVREAGLKITVKMLAKEWGYNEQTVKNKKVNYDAQYGKNPMQKTDNSKSTF